MITLEQCLKYAELGYLSKHESDDGKLIGFKYSLDTVYNQRWDEVTLCSRGITFEKETGKIIAWPFNKFFNIQEVYAQDGSLAAIGKILNELDGWRPFTSSTYTIAEKVDGSLGIAYFYNGQWYVKTVGSFNSEQAIWATKYLNEKMNTSKMVPGWTYCFEIVYKDDPHVVQYDKEELVLLSIFNDEKQPHYEMSYFALRSIGKIIGCRVAEEYHFESLEKCIDTVSKMDVNHEGVVITFYNEFGDSCKVKIKSEAFLEMFHRLSCITFKEIREHFNSELGIIDPEYEKAIPEELVEMKEYVKTINSMVNERYCKCVELEKDVLNYPIGRERYEFVSAQMGNLTGAMMAYLKYRSGGGNIAFVYESIFKVVKNILKN